MGNAPSAGNRPLEVTSPATGGLEAGRFGAACDLRDDPREKREPVGPEAERAGRVARHLRPATAVIPADLAEGVQHNLDALGY